MPNFGAELAAILGKVNRPGDFFVSGRGEFLMPRLEVAGVGPIALPLLPIQARQLVEAATRAPYGRGQDTIVDETVRRTWQIEASRVSLGGKAWPNTLAEIVAKAAQGLGVEGSVTAELYKLLIYDEGSFFVGHRDTEKAPGMFATLVIALPSQSEGGDLIVRHGERDARVNLRVEEPSELAFAAFYADCVHEVTEVTAGCRATLVFNLLREGKGRALKAPGYETETRQAAALLAAWAGDGAERPIAPSADKEAEPHAEKLVYPLEHAYTPAELAFDKLKGVDAAVARALVEAAPLARCDLHLALLKIEEQGSAESKGDWGHRRRRYGRDDEDEDEDFEVIEVYESERTLSHWRRPDGSVANLGALPFLDAEISPPDALADMEPESQHFHEATGNEGASFERTYARAALVIWPAARILAVINQAGLEATLPYLGELIDEEKTAQAVELAGHMLATWPANRYPRRGEAPTELGRMLSLLARLGDAPLVEDALGKLIGAESHANGDSAAVVEALKLLPTDRAVAWLERIVDAVVVETPGAAAGLLAAAVEGAFAARPDRLAGAANRLVDRLPGNPATAPTNAWGRPRGESMSIEDVVRLVRAVDRIDGTIAGRAARHALAWPKAYGLDEIVIPAVKRLIEAGHEAGPAFEALRAAGLAHLQKRIDAPLEPPKDWRRPSDVGCKCEHCAGLSKFLADPGLQSWALKALQNIRTHVEHQARDAKADVDMTTLRKGSPHSLNFVKNDGSYRRRVAERQRDLADRDALALR